MSAEFPADFTGGFVSILTQNTAVDNQVSFQYGTSFITGTTFSNIRLLDGYKCDYIGFGAGKRSLPTNTPSDLRVIPIQDAVDFTKKINGKNPSSIRCNVSEYW